ncbi:hypothetical protein FDU21_04005 [Xanthomonas oryzae pv. oryzae]|nr:hypothetical protein FDU21_04005 [Xanthomonas oryzae pv. oryzae]
MYMPSMSDSARAHSIALVQGNALGGGFEAALSCHTIIAEEGVMMGLPSAVRPVSGDGRLLFHVPARQCATGAKIMLEGNLYSAEQLLGMGLVDRVVPRGQGVAAVEQVIREQAHAACLGGDAAGARNDHRSTIGRDDAHHRNLGRYGDAVRREVVAHHGSPGPRAIASLRA